MNKSNIALAIGISAFALFIFSPQSAHAVAENDACTAAQEGEWRQLDSPEGETHLFCNGANWVAFRKFQDGDIVFEPGSEPVLTIKDEGSIQLQAVTGLGTPSYAGLNDLSDVDAAAPTASDVLTWDGSDWIAQAVAGGSFGEEALSDVCTAAQEGNLAQLASPDGETHLWCDGSNWQALHTLSMSGSDNILTYNLTRLAIDSIPTTNTTTRIFEATDTGGTTIAYMENTRNGTNDSDFKIGSKDGYIRFYDGAGCCDPNTAISIVASGARVAMFGSDYLLDTPSGESRSLIFTNASGGWSAAEITATKAAGSNSNGTLLLKTRGHAIDQLYLDDVGNVGIGTVSPGYQLEVNGDAAKPGGGSWFNASDARLKDVHGAYDKGLDDLLRLKPVRFSYAEGNARGLPTDTEYVGFIAQDVQPVFPEAISQRKDGYLDFNIHPLNVALINAVQELKAENDNLRARLEALEARLPAKPEPTGYNQ